ncbi:NUDIX hydrolase [Candidatus Saccharibacteria bacterium]|nr:NUDIX hydrolase [Candidatus Saccharibacteria bacterium]
MSKDFSQGVIEHGDGSTRPTDYLYRISLKALIRDEQGRVLVVKETGRDWWDLPGGGMDHGETITSALARELHEEVNVIGGFTWHIITAEEPAYLANHDFWQLRLIIEVLPETLVFSVGEDGDEVAFMAPETFRTSTRDAERCIFTYATTTNQA